MKILINTRYGGFELSKAAYKKLGLKWDGYGYLDNDDLGIKDDLNMHAHRTVPRAIAVVESVGIKESAGDYSHLKIVEIPDGIDWYIDDCDGLEEVHEQYEEWRRI